MKKCIFHYPGPLLENPSVGSQVRPNMMLKAFRELGYEVEVISGYSRDRKKTIKDVKRNIEAGVQYDFLYSESTSMPTALSDSDHLPRNPFMDEKFLGYCRKKGIPVGLFYRDAYWQFSFYKEQARKWIPYVTIPFYRHELERYNYCTDILFVPSEEFAQAIGYRSRFMELPSGGKLVSDGSEKKTGNDIKLFYVGGVTGLYNIDLVADTISKCDNTTLTICCPEEQWQVSSDLRQIVEATDNITVVHERGEGVTRHLKQADIALVLFERNPYRDFAMPVKLFEYLGAGRPIIATDGTAAGRYVTANGVGWAIDYDAEALMKLLNDLKNTSEIQAKKDRAAEVAKQNTWLSRAETVAETLTKHV